MKKLYCLILANLFISSLAMAEGEKPFLFIQYSPPAEELDYYNNIVDTFFYYDEYRLYLGTSIANPCSDLTLSTNPLYSSRPNYKDLDADMVSWESQLKAVSFWSYPYLNRLPLYFSSANLQKLSPTVPYTCLKQDLVKDGIVYSTGEIKLNWDEEAKSYKPLSQAVKVQLPSQAVIKFVLNKNKDVSDVRVKLYAGSCGWLSGNNLNFIGGGPWPWDKLAMLSSNILAQQSAYSYSSQPANSPWGCIRYDFTYQMNGIKKTVSTPNIKLTWDAKKQAYVKAQPKEVTLDLS